MRPVFTLALVAALALSGPALGEHPAIDRWAERPAAQAGVDGSFSILYRIVNLPAGNNTVEFDYEVDSDPGDKLKLYVGSLTVWEVGGRYQRGRAKVAICPGGPCLVAFIYDKDANTSRGLDSARVDNVVFHSSSAGRIETHRFDTPSDTIPAGWTGLGLGGWTTPAQRRPLSVGRPPGHALLGTAAGVTASWLQRTFKWPAPDPNSLAFDYYVDSEENGDFLRVLIDGTVAWEMSGRNRAGHATLAVIQGTHDIRFEYRKNAAVDEGLDTARVDNVVARSGGKVAEIHRFEGRPLDRQPHIPGEPDVEWTAGGEANGWVVNEVLPPRSYVPGQQDGQQLAPNFQAFSPPVVDGKVQGDYRNPTETALHNYGNPLAGPGTLSLVASRTASALFIGLRVPGSNPLIGSEGGEVIVYLDDRRLDTLRDRGCEDDLHAPGLDDRRIAITYHSDPLASTAQIDPIKQDGGDCRGSFSGLNGRPAWPVNVAVTEPLADPGFVHFELRIDLPAGSPAFVDDLVGLGLSFRTTSGASSAVRLPFRDDGAGPIESDIHSWETLHFSFTPNEPELSENYMDARCCYPRPSRPGVHW